MENTLMNIEHRICEGCTDKEIMEELGILRKGHSTTTNRRYASYPQRYSQRRIHQKYLHLKCK
jgi:hypothetical protein